MSRRLGSHRLRPALSTAARSKAQIKLLEAAIAAARRAADTGRVVELENRLHWALVNSMR